MTARMHGGLAPLTLVPKQEPQQTTPCDWFVERMDSLTLRRHQEAQKSAQRHAEAEKQRRLAAALNAWGTTP